MTFIRVLTVLAVIVLSYIIYSFLGTGSSDTINIWYQLKGNARGQKYYLAKRILNDNDVDVTFENSYAKLVPLDEMAEDTTLFLTESTEVLTQRQLMAIENWVRDGGKVVAQGDVQIYPYERNVNRQGELVKTDEDVLPWLTDDEGSDNEDEEDYWAFNSYKHRYGIMDYLGLEKVYICQTKVASDFPSEVTHSLDLPNGKMLTVNVGYGVKYEYSSDIEEADTYPLKHQVPAPCAGSLVDSYQVGKGTITFYHSPSLLFSDRPHGKLNDENRKARIAEYDHASYLLYVLSQDGNLPKNVRWFQSPYYPSYLNMLKKYGFPVLLAITFGILAFIWRNLRRFGPYIVEDKRKALSLKRHIQASGQFLYDNDARDVLLADTQKVLIDELNRVIHNFDILNDEKRVEAVIKLTNLPEKMVSLALEKVQENKFNDTSFTQKIKAIQTIREKL